jgi:hypothetical protein
MKLFLILSMIITSYSLNAQSLSQTSRGNKFNPSIGLNALTLYKNGSREVENDGISIQEIELQFSSDVDAYFRAEATIALHQEESEEGEHSHEFKVEPEEIFVETLSIPNMTLKLGKFYANFGKYNAIHSHALPFIYRGKVQEEIFGDEGLAEAGIGLSFLAPAPWFSEVSIQALQPTNETLFVDSHHSMAYVLKWKNLWDLSDAMTLEWGLSGLSFSDHNHRSELEAKTRLYGTDLTFKWRPTKDGKSSSFMWSTEYIQKHISGTENLDENINKKIGGITSFVRYQLAQRWYAQAQYEFLGLGKNDDTKDINAYTALLALIPTEFSSIRAQFDSIHDGNDKPEKRLSLQLNISIGAHPAHVY